MINGAAEILALRRPTLWTRFRGFRYRTVPHDITSVEEAYLLGLRIGYEEGLMDGIDLGFDTGNIMAVEVDSLAACH